MAYRPSVALIAWDWMHGHGSTGSTLLAYALIALPYTNVAFKFGVCVVLPENI